MPRYKILEIVNKGSFTFRVELIEPQRCPMCDGERLRVKDRFLRRIWHTLIGQRQTGLEVLARKYQCRGCGRCFSPRMPGVKLKRRAREPCLHEVMTLHHNGWTQKSLSDHIRMGSATVERWYQDHFAVKNRELLSADCPRIMGIDEHFFTKKKGFTTTIADLSK